VEFRKVRFAAPILHSRWRLAWNRFASHACRSRRFTASACELDAVEEPSSDYNVNFRISGGIRTSSHSRPMDAHRGSFGCVTRNLADRDDNWRLMGYGLLGTTACALAMLAPGLWSVDARLFGWKRVESSPRKISSNS
jgi:hypothetical protein